MDKRSRRVLTGAVLAASALTLTPALPASAHAVITVGAYHVAMGWQSEPATGTSTYVDQANAVQVFVDKPSGSNPLATPVSDLNSDCTKPDFQVTVTFGPTTSSPLCPQPTFDADTGKGRADEYDAVLIPTAVGTYTFRIFGTIHGTPIDQSVSSGTSTFDGVGDQVATEFPTAVPVLSDLGSRINQVDGRATHALAAASSAGGSSGTATVLAIIALVVAVAVAMIDLARTLRRRGDRT